MFVFSKVIDQLISAILLEINTITKGFAGILRESIFLIIL